MDLITPGELRAPARCCRVQHATPVQLHRCLQRVYTWLLLANSNLSQVAQFCCFCCCTPRARALARDLFRCIALHPRPAGTTYSVAHIWSYSWPAVANRCHNFKGPQRSTSLVYRILRQLVASKWSALYFLVHHFAHHCVSLLTDTEFCHVLSST